VIEDLTLSNASRIVFLIMDGVGDIPNPDHAYMTPLEAARKPNMDRLAVERGVLGRIIPVDVGITPGSGPGHLSLFGYDPLKVDIGRGILEVLGLNMEIEETDVAGEDGNFDGKVKAIEAVDTIMPDLLSANPQVLVITGDHSTPCPLKGHSWHPVPMLLLTGTGERDSLPFHEKNCLRGSIGTIYSRELMSLALAHAARLDKYGA